ncbi:MAG: hypothetical protein R2788_12925 [Saprospiraceae bacterium]
MTAALKLIFDKINERKFETAQVADYESWLEIPLAIALFLLLLEFIILGKINCCRVDVFKMKV